MICVLLYWYWLLWNIPDAQMAKSFFALMSTLEIGIELVAIICLIFIIFIEWRLK